MGRGVLEVAVKPAFCRSACDVVHGSQLYEMATIQTSGPFSFVDECLCDDGPIGAIQHSVRMLESRTMPQFVIERDIPGAGSLTEEQLRQVSLQSLDTLKNMGPQIQWLHSYVTEDKVYCVYLAPDEETIRDHARKSGIRADRVSAVRRLIDPATFK
jgi:hypothetical protein